MSTFSLLQISLDQSIERDSFIEAAAGAEMVTKADLSQYYRDLYGIVVSEISFADATVVKAALDARSFPVEIVNDIELPPLPDVFQMQRVDLQEDGLSFTDALSRISLRRMEDLVFLSAGYFLKTRPKSELKMGTAFMADSRKAELNSTRVFREEVEKEFRIEFFFASEPYRLRLSLTNIGAVFVNGRALQLHKAETITVAITELKKLLPADRTNQGVEKVEMIYPSLRAYEEEIRWHFYRLIEDR